MADKLKESIEYIAEKLEEGIKKVVVTGAVVLSSLTGTAKENAELARTDEEPFKTEQSFKEDKVLSNNKEDKNISFKKAQEQLQDALKEQREDSVVNANDVTNVNIGAFKHANLYNASIQELDKDARPDFRAGLERDEIKAQTRDELNEAIQDQNGGAAFCDGDAYHLPKYVLSDELKNELKEELDANNTAVAYVLGSPIADLMVKTHEVDVHGLHFAQNSVGNSGDTPYMAFVTNEMTEKLATISEYLVLAELYTNLKNAGVENFEDKEKGLIPLDNILDMKPDLKEYILKNGFDINDKECIKDIAKMGADYWDKNLSEAYNNQSERATYDSEQSSLIGMVKAAREWEERKEMMLSGININGKEVDIPKECLDFIVPSDEKAGKILGNEKYISNEDLLKIDKHLDSLGLKSDEEKSNYLLEQAIHITSRHPEADLKLRDILLECENGSRHDKTITYSDGIKDTFNNDGTVSITNKEGNISYNTSKDELNEINNNKENDVEKTNKKSPKDELKENLAQIHPTVENVQTQQNQNIDMYKMMKTRER